ncbi:MAG: FeS-binding protein [Chloroflexi bacterium]|nr:MAG: FeS-binding protein [Chloroflexota bacterium]RLC94940.1 MAG: FeS-binding protein [Chloroflexota bacterium]
MRVGGAAARDQFQGCKLKRCVMLIFSPEVVAEPIIYNLAMQFGLTTNIRRANLSESGGWAVVQLEGKEKDIDSAIEWATGKGVRIDPAGDQPEA